MEGKNLSEFIGEYLCPNCGIVQISDGECVTVKYPIGLEPPEAKITCSCGAIIVSYVEWEEALLFEKRGAKTEGFSFSNSTEITENEIIEFMGNIDTEIKEFFNACS